MRIPLFLLLALTGCRGPAPVALGDMAARLFDGPSPQLDLEGRIIGLDQQPLPGIAVSLCQTTCRETTTGARGEYSFPGVPIGLHSLHAHKPGASDYAALDFPLYLQGDPNPRLLPLVLPRVGPFVPLLPGPQTVAVDGPLSLSLDGRALALPQGGVVARLAAVRIPLEIQPNFCVPSARVLAMWAFAPTGVTSQSPIRVQLAESLGLAPGTTVSFIEIDPKDGSPTVAASGSVSPDGKSIQTANGAGLRRLSWLLLAVLSGGA